MSLLIGISGLLLYVSSSGIAQSLDATTTPWHLEKDKNGIKVYSRLPEGSKFKEVKVACEIEGTLSQLFAFLSDVEYYPEVVYKNKLSYKLKQQSERDFIYYCITAFPWPLKNRDLVIHMVFTPDPEHKALFIKANDVKGIKPEEADLVRIPFWHADWVVKKESASRISIAYSFKVDPGGSLPPWMVNLGVSTGPYISFSNMEQVLKLPRYQGKIYSFLNF